MRNEMLERVILKNLQRVETGLKEKSLMCAVEIEMDRPDLTTAEFEDAIRSLAKTCGQIMNGSGANRVAEMGKAHNERIYGAHYDPDDLPQEKPYMTESDFYSRELAGANYSLFAKAVND